MANQGGGGGPNNMGRPSHRPENAFKRAEELLVVNDKAAALQQLHDIVSNKRYRTWQPILERIMLKHVELSVEMKQARLAKDALLQFKNVCQNTNIASLDTVIRHLLALAQARVDNAQESSAARQLAVQIADLDEGDSPETVLMRSVTGEDSKDRTDREVVAPWLRFLWETYRLALDVLRNNSKLEALYHSTALQAFQFCLKYERKSEFRRLCDMLRLHLSNLTKYSHQTNAVSLSNADSLQLHMETRFAQLGASVQLELWQESSRTVDDLYGLMRQSRKPLKSSVMASYYDKMAQIFLVSDNWLMHAFALRRQFQKSGSKMTPDDRRDFATTVVLAALAAPLDSTAPRSLVTLIDGDGDGASRNIRLAEYLNMTKAPTRDLLMRELTSRDILDTIHAPIRDLFTMVEKEFHPLTLCNRLAPITEFMKTKPQFERYIRPIQEVALTRLVQQLSQIYRLVKLDTIAQLVTFETPDRIEKFLVERSKRGEITLRVDHLSRTVSFDPSATVGQGGASRSSLQADEYRTQLTSLAQRLHSAVQLITPPKADDVAARRKALAEQARAEVKKERVEVLQRRGLIEQKKEEQETQQQRREQEAARERRQRMEQEAEIERKRLAEESKRREMERIQKERETIEREQKQKMALEMKRKSDAAGLKLDLEELVDLDTDQLVAKQVEQLEAEKKEMRTRLNTLGKRIDHLERAMRKEELPLFAADYERQKKQDRAYHDEQTAAARKLAEEQHQRDLAVRARLLRMVDDSKSLREQILESRRGEFERKRADALARLEAEKARRREEFRKAKEEELRRARDEEEQRRLLDEERRRRQAEDEEQERLAVEARANAPASTKPTETTGSAPGKYVPPAARAAMASSGGAPPVPSLLRRAGDDAPPVPSLLRRAGDDAPPPRRSAEPASSAPAPAPAAAAPASSGKYVPPSRRAAEAASAPPPAAAPAVPAPAPAAAPSPAPAAGKYVPPNRRGAGA